MRANNYGKEANITKIQTLDYGSCEVERRPDTESRSKGSNRSSNRGGRGRGSSGDENPKSGSQSARAKGDNYGETQKTLKSRMFSGVAAHFQKTYRVSMKTLKPSFFVSANILH